MFSIYTLAFYLKFITISNAKKVVLFSIFLLLINSLNIGLKFCCIVLLSIVVQMEIFVKGLDGKTKTLNVKSSYRMAKVKEMIFDNDGIPVHDQRLIFGGRNLDGNQTLANYNITDTSTLHLVLRLLGD